jgi:metal-sulfur cluster biosynthetic enzyme
MIPRGAFTIELTTPACPVKDQMRDQAAAAVQALPGVSSVDVQMTAKVECHVSYTLDGYHFTF